MRAAQILIEEFVRRDAGRGVWGGEPHFPGGGAQSAQERHRLRRIGTAAADCYDNGPCRLRCEMEQIIGAICRQFGRRRIESQHGSSLLVIKTVIGQGGRCTTESTMDHAAVGPVEATYF